MASTSDPQPPQPAGPQAQSFDLLRQQYGDLAYADDIQLFGSSQVTPVILDADATDRVPPTLDLTGRSDASWQVTGPLAPMHLDPPDDAAAETDASPETGSLDGSYVALHSAQTDWATLRDSRTAIPAGTVAQRAAALEAPGPAPSRPPSPAPGSTN